MECNVCIAIKTKKWLIEKLEKCPVDPSGWKITGKVIEPNAPIPEGFHLVWDGTETGFDFVLRNCNCNHQKISSISTIN